MSNIDIETSIMEKCIEGWNLRFGGTSAIDVAEKLKIDHAKVRNIFRKFRDNGKGSINEDAELMSVSITPNKPGSMKQKKVVTTIFFPSKNVLSDYYYSSKLAKENHPEFEKRLYLGHSQIELCYFSISVLKRYQDQQEKYELEDSASGGYLCSNSTYAENIDDSEYISSINFGKRTLSDGNYAIVVFLKDLSYLPIKEQSYWHSHEITKPTFSFPDKDFLPFYLRYFEGIPTDYSNPIGELADVLTSINRLLIQANLGKLFTGLSNPYLTFPVDNTRKHFADSNSELYKIIGPDGMKKKVLRNILKKEFSLTDSDLKHIKSGRDFSTMQLFSELVNKLDANNNGLKIIEEVKNYRIDADHRIIKPEFTDTNYIKSFREIIESLIEFYSQTRTNLSVKIGTT